MMTGHDEHPRILDLGCGPGKAPGAFGVDRRALPGVDLVHDLAIRPWPIESGAYDRIVIRHVIEHVDDVIGFFDEVHRVAANGATVEIVTPHFSNRCAYLDPTHRHTFSARFLEFVADAPPWRPASRLAVARSWLFEHHHDMAPLGAPGRFAIATRRVTFSRVFRMLGVAWLANAKIDFYEFYLAHLFPARDIEATLSVKKDESGQGAGKEHHP
ncbi:class I SAM-dependent methyltransferase [bacterium]|nr:class I SAM-dependent methyltransferase [bacterium]